MSSKIREPNSIQSVQIGFDLLRVLADAPGEMPLGELARDADMTKSKAHKYLASLLKCGLVVQRTAGGAYDLGPVALDLGLAAMRRLDVTQLGQSTLDRLRDVLDTTATMAIWGNRGPTIVRWAETPYIVSQSVQLGTVFPVLTSTLGLVFATWLDARLTDKFIAEELDDPKGAARKSGLKSLTDVRKMLAQIRRDGMRAADSIVAPGVASISAPVFQHGNRIAAVVAVAGLQGRLDLSLSGRPAKVLAAEAKILSAQLGARH